MGVASPENSLWLGNDHQDAVACRGCEFALLHHSNMPCLALANAAPSKCKHVPRTPGDQQTMLKGKGNMGIEASMVPQKLKHADAHARLASAAAWARSSASCASSWASSQSRLRELQVRDYCHSPIKLPCMRCTLQCNGGEHMQGCVDQGATTSGDAAGHIVSASQRRHMPAASRVHAIAGVPSAVCPHGLHAAQLGPEP